MVLFEDDPKFALGYAFCSNALKRGVYLSPYHNMFINAAMTEQDIVQTLEATGAAFEDLQRNRETVEPSSVLMALMAN